MNAVAVSVVASLALSSLGGLLATTRAAPAEPEGDQVMLGFWFDSADRE